MDTGGMPHRTPNPTRLLSLSLTPTRHIRHTSPMEESTRKITLLYVSYVSDRLSLGPPLVRPLVPLSVADTV